MIGMAVTTIAAAMIGVIAPQSANGCEIHVWPAAKLNTLTEGAIWNNVLDSAVTPRSGGVRERVVPAAGPLDPEGQLHLIESVDLPALLRVPGAQVIIHNEVARRRATGGATGRQTNSDSKCYSELTVAKNFFNRSGLAERTLRTLFILDDYGNQPLPRRSFVAWGSTELQIFPAKVAEREQAASEELARAFQTNTRQFAGYAFAPPRKR
jgi:hypothetical protein